MTAYCQCETPRPSPNPRHNGACVCGRRLDPRASCNDATMQSFMDGLAVIFPDPPEWFEHFRSHIERREKAGRDYFGESYQGKDNAGEAMEEIADACIYTLLHTLRMKREGKDALMDVALTVARDAANAYRGLLVLQGEARKP